MAKRKTKKKMAQRSQKPAESSPEPLTPDDLASESTVKKSAGWGAYVIPAIAVIFLLANIGLFVYLQYTSNKQNAPSNVALNTSPAPSLTPTFTPTPYPLPQGKQTYFVSVGNGTAGPKIEQVTIDPYDPKPGESQTYTVAASSDKPVKSLEMVLTTDTKAATYSLMRTDGSDTKGTWQVKITTNDTHFYKYSPLFTITSVSGESRKTELTLRAY